MKLIKNLFAATLMLSIAGFAAADEWDDFGSDDSSSEPAVTISGAAEVAGRIYTDQNGKPDSAMDLQDMPAESKYSGKLNFDYSGASSDVSFKLKFDNNSLGDYKEDILEEFTARAYLGNFQIEAGKMKTVWGKGDKIHVVDNFNANDYTDFVYPDYIDRRIAEPMFRLVYSTNSNIKFEGIYTPMMTADRLASDGIFQPAASKTLTETVSGIVAHNMAATIAASAADLSTPTGASGVVSSIMSASKFSSDDLYGDNIKTIKYGQAGVRTTFTLGGIDLGLSYYYGHAKQPSANLGSYIASVTKATVAGVTQAVSAYATANSTEIKTKYYKEISTTATAIGTAYGQAVAAAAAAGTTYSVYDNVTKTDVTLTDTTTIQTVASHNAFAKCCSDHGQEWYAAGLLDQSIIDAYTGSQTYDLPELNYDQLQVFGLEAAFVLWKFNIRGEGAYYLTKDTAGDNPWIQNNSIQWVGGFDMDMPWTNMNLNVQTQGKYIMNSDKIKDGAYAKYDVDYNSDDKYISNKIIVDITDSYAHDSIKIDVKGIYDIECKDYVVMPALTIKAVDDFSITASGMWLVADNENSEFYNFRRSSFAQLSCKYLF